jgi:Na+/melibiose symporter-like transporter
MKQYFIIAIIILIISVLGALFANGLIMLFLFAELASLVSFYIFFSVIVPSLFPELRDVDENFNCGASELYLNHEEMYNPKLPFGGMKNK